MANDRPTDTRTPGAYEIRCRGELGAHWQAWFDGLTVRRAGDGTTLITGAFGDQAALHGVLGRLRDLGIPIVSLRQLVTPEHDTGEDTP